ncbi:MAG: PocR ligand-binding domain-containing protein [Planctomycetes bacterium]|nr:PocR ligand-binding domain-containing protein [Planctomycetota bacterium]
MKQTKLLTVEHFRRIEESFRRHFDLGLETAGLDGIAIRGMCSGDFRPEFCRVICDSRTALARCKQQRIRHMRISMSAGVPYISLCHAGIVLGCVPIMDKDRALGGLFFGKCLWDAFDDDTKGDILNRLRGLRLKSYLVTPAAKRLPVISARELQRAADLLFVLLYETTNLTPGSTASGTDRDGRRKRGQNKEPEKTDSAEHNDGPADIGPCAYRQAEKLNGKVRELIGRIRIEDTTGAKEILNLLLASMVFHEPCDRGGVLRARMVELLSVLDRTAAECGNDTKALFRRRRRSLDELAGIDLAGIDSEGGLCRWVSKALDNFIKDVYLLRDRVKMAPVNSAIDHIEINLDRRLTLAEIAMAADLSASRLNHLFKEQMSVSPINYLTYARIRCAKRLLLNTDKNCCIISREAGFRHSGYFTRKFREIVGTTPLQFRQNNV